MQKINNPIRLLSWRVEEGKNGDETRHIYIVAANAVAALERALAIWGANTQDDEAHFTVAFEREMRV